MRVFIDTNIYLKLFTPPGDQSEYLDKLISLVSDKKISIVFPKIIQHEILRNINAYTARYQKRIEETKVKKPEFQEIHDTETRSKIEKAFSSWTEAVEELSGKYLLIIEKITKKIFEEFKPSTHDFEELDDLVQLASSRKLKGYPPGKGNHIGDQLAWEILKKYCKDDDIVIISYDGDWDDSTKRNKKELNMFLRDEWKEVSDRNISLFDSLGEFLRQFPEGKEISKKDIEEEKSVSAPFSQRINPTLGVYNASDQVVWPQSSPFNFGTVPNIVTTPFSSGASLSVEDLSTCPSCGLYYIKNIAVINCPFCGMPTF